MTGLAFQDIISRLNEYWSAQGCIVQQPYDVEVGAGTMAPATFLRVLGPEPWNVAYPQGCRRPADGRYAENPNRYQHYFQYQVILKPSPRDPQGVYLESLKALGIAIEQHDLRFVEDNWESPALGAWGLGWEVWLDGLEITQFTYFQQAGGLNLDPPSVEITYGLERIAMYLQGVRDIAAIRWTDRPTPGSEMSSAMCYGDLYREAEVQHCTYNFEQADVSMLQQLFDLYEAEAQRIVSPALVLPALDYVLKCSHVFNLLDARGAVGVTQRAAYFGRMQALARRVASSYVARREELEFPLGDARAESHGQKTPDHRDQAPTPPGAVADFLFELGTEELPPRDLDSAIKVLEQKAPEVLQTAGFAWNGAPRVAGTPRRLILTVRALKQVETDRQEVVKGPPARAAYDGDGRPTKAAEGFARSIGVEVSKLRVAEEGGREYVFADRRLEARAAMDALGQACLDLIGSLSFTRMMYWDHPSVTFSRPIRWLAPIWGEAVVPLTYAGLSSAREVQLPRHQGSRSLPISSASSYSQQLRECEVEPEPQARLQLIEEQFKSLLHEGYFDPASFDSELAEEVKNLLEWPHLLMGDFEPAYLKLPEAVLTTVMKKHQRYFPVRDPDGLLQPRFVVAVNGESHRDFELIKRGNEEVLRARFADALFFFEHDQRDPLDSYVPKLSTITFQEKLGSYLEKTERLALLAPQVAAMLTLQDLDRGRLDRAARLSKADLATGLVRELPELQGVIGRNYAYGSGEHPDVADAILEHYKPRSAGDLPAGQLGLVLGIADRVDTLVGGFAAGLEPTGSSDPYGLRRAALSLLQLIIGKEIDVSLGALVELAVPLSPVPLQSDVLENLKGFFRQRLRVMLREDAVEIPLEVIDSVLGSLGDRPWAAAEVARQLPEYLNRPEVTALTEALNRAARIQPKDGVTYQPDAEALEHPAEHRLYAAIQLAESARHIPVSDLEGFLGQLQGLTEPINAFFEQLMVNDPDERKRANRLGMLRTAVDLAGERFDVSQLGGGH